MTKNKFQLTRTKSAGVPCLWEGGGGATNTGSARIIAGADGLPKKAVYVRRRGSLSCGDHALIPVAAGDFVVDADHHRQDFRVMVWRITTIPDTVASAELVTEYAQGGFTPYDLPATVASGLEGAISAAREKALCYHCREPHYIAG